MFADRTDAGRKLARALERYRGANDTIVLGIPRGGVVVAAEVASELGLPLDVLIAAKVGAPGNPEYAIGSVAPDGIVMANPESGFSLAEVEHLSGEAKAKVAEKTAAFRHGRAAEPLTGRTAILVDDGLATGLTARAAIAYLRRQKVARIVLAVPVASDSAVRAIKPEVDELVSLDIPLGFFAVGQFYRRFEQTTDAEVEALLSAPR